MKTVILLLLGAVLAIAGERDSANKERLAQQAARDADTLRELLEEDWTVRSKGSEITITSKFDVFFVGLTSRASVAPVFSDNTSRKELLDEAKPEKYVIRLRYTNRMSREDYERRRNERQKIADHLNSGSTGKSDWEDLFRKFQDLKLPRYRDTCDIYEELPVRPGVGTYPPKACQKVGGARQILEIILRPGLSVFD